MNDFTRNYLLRLHIGLQKAAALSPAARAGLVGAGGAGAGGLMAGGALGAFEAWNNTRMENLSVSKENRKDEGASDAGGGAFR